MVSLNHVWRYAQAAVLFALPTAAAIAQDRANDNAVTQAEDAFGFSVGRETLGIYNAGNARGFSPTAAGNVRIDGLYFDPAFSLNSTISNSTSIKVGLSAQGYPFAAPSGIVDQSLNRPGHKTSASIIANGDSFGSGGLEIDGSLPLSETLDLGYGLTGGHIEYPDGTDNWDHGESLIARWRPMAGVEIAPFWSLYNDYDDESGDLYIPAGRFLPPPAIPRLFDGPRWLNNRYTAVNEGLVATASSGKDWLVRLGAFRSVFDHQTSFADLLVDLQPDGSANRLIIADPPTRNVSLSGELRVTHSIAEGPRLHVVHLSLRERDARREFGGSEEIDLGPTHIGERSQAEKPDFHFGPISHDRVQQMTYGIAYDGRWKDVGELGFGISRANYRKTTLLPATAPLVSRSRPWLYNATAAANLAKTLIVYAGYARGLEESGVAPDNAANRNQPLPAILTEQKDAGLRLDFAGGIKAVVGVFDLSRPYFGFDAANRYTQVGSTRSRGAEFSISGKVTPRVDMVLGGVLLRPRVVRDAAVAGTIGKRPAGLPTHQINLNVNWRTPMLAGLDLDLAVAHRGSMPTTTDNLVFLPPRARVDLGGHYRFKLSDRSATLRLQIANVFNNQSGSFAGPGIYTGGPSRYLTGYLAVDI